VIDKHDLFQKQWAKRKAFYRKQNYKIIHTTSMDYTPDTSKWRVVESKNKTIGDATSSEMLQGTCFLKIKSKKD
jgi:lipocalin